jgi:hypothetical protein
MKNQLQINLFEGHAGVELLSTTFIRGAQIHSIRGKYSPNSTSGAFQWTRAVRALTVLICGTALNQNGSFALKGESDSLASSLDYATSKSPQWLVNMFGCSHNGIPFAKLLIRRENPERKRGGHVAVHLNTRIIAPSDIVVSYRGQALQNQTLGDLTWSLINNLTQGHHQRPIVKRAEKINDWTLVL